MHPIGEGYSASSVQMNSVAATVANGGVRLQPTLLKAVADNNGRPLPAGRPSAERIRSQDFANQFRGMLEGAQERGRHRRGMAQRADSGGYGGYGASLIESAAADPSQLVISVCVQDPRNGYYLDAVAEPAFCDIVSLTLRSVWMPPTGAASSTPEVPGRMGATAMIQKRQPHPVAAQGAR